MARSRGLFARQAQLLHRPLTYYEDIYGERNPDEEMEGVHILDSESDTDHDHEAGNTKDEDEDDEVIITKVIRKGNVVDKRDGEEYGDDVINTGPGHRSKSAIDTLTPPPTTESTMKRRRFGMFSLTQVSGNATERDDNDDDDEPQKQSRKTRAEREKKPAVDETPTKRRRRSVETDTIKQKRKRYDFRTRDVQKSNYKVDWPSLDEDSSNERDPEREIGPKPATVPVPRSRAARKSAWADMERNEESVKKRQRDLEEQPDTPTESQSPKEELTQTQGVGSKQDTREESALKGKGRKRLFARHGETRQKGGEKNERRVVPMILID